MALRTHPADVQGGIAAAQESGVAIEACAFIGSSPIRRYAEDWSLDTMLRSVETSVTALNKAGLPDNRGTLHTRIVSFMEHLANVPKHVISYFLNPWVQYAAPVELL